MFPLTRLYPWFTLMTLKLTVSTLNSSAMFLLHLYFESKYHGLRQSFHVLNIYLQYSLLFHTNLNLAFKSHC